MERKGKVEKNAKQACHGAVYRSHPLGPAPGPPRRPQLPVLTRLREVNPILLAGGILIAETLLFARA